MKLNREDYIEILETAMSWIVVMAMVVYGGGKIVQFTGMPYLNKPVSELTGMQLMWAFYGYSQPFVLTLGLFEILGGMLVFFKRTRIIGCLFTSAILINIILQDYFYGVHIGALKAAILYQLLIFAILRINKNRLLQAIRVLMFNDYSEKTTRKRIRVLTISFLLFVLFRVGEYLITIRYQ